MEVPVGCGREGHAEYRVIKKGQRAGAQRYACVAPDGARHLFSVPLAAPASRDRLHLVEPRLALLACEYLASTGELDGAETLAEAVLGKRTSDTGFTDLATWLTWNRQALAAAKRKAKSRVITNERLARPAGRVNANPYSLT